MNKLEYLIDNLVEEATKMFPLEHSPDPIARDRVKLGLYALIEFLQKPLQKEGTPTWYIEYCMHNILNDKVVEAEPVVWEVAALNEEEATKLFNSVFRSTMTCRYVIMSIEKEVT